MLDDNNKKEEEKEATYLEGKRQESIETILKVAGIFVVLGFLLIYGATMKGTVKKPIGNGGAPGEEEVKSYFQYIASNYSMDLTKEINGKTEVIKYTTDGTFDLYNFENDSNGYLIYKDTIYLIDNEKFTIKNYNGTLNIVNDKYADARFIKDVSEYCTIEIITSGEATCKVGFGDYITKYNEKYGTSIEYSGEEVLIFNIEYSGSINNIKVDYTEINKIINNSSDNIVYNYKLYNYRLNDFSTLYEIYPDTIKK